jgi:hypothetical protein
MAKKRLPWHHSKEIAAAPLAGYAQLAFFALESSAHNPQLEGDCPANFASSPNRYATANARRKAVGR